MKRILLFLLPALFFLNNSYSQQRVKDSLVTLLKKEKQDTGRVMLLCRLSYNYYGNKPDTALILAFEALSLSRRIGFVKGEAKSLISLGLVYDVLRDWPKEMGALLQALKLDEKANNFNVQSGILNNIGNIYRQQGDYRQAISYYLKGRILAENAKNQDGIAVNLGNLSRCYFGLKQYDSALVYIQQANVIATKFKYRYRTANFLTLIGDIYAKTGQTKLAMRYYRLSIPYKKVTQQNLRLNESYLGMAKLFENAGQRDSALFYANRAFNISKSVGKFNYGVQNAGMLLYSFHKTRRNTDSALYYLEIATAAKDSTFSPQQINKFRSIDIEEKMRQQEILKEQERYNNRLKMYGLLAAIAVFLVITTILWRNNHSKKQANNKIQNTLAELKATQNQIIQSEKMASLGELTAGIAHEIQNPLNFVNNFSEVNTELIDEMQEEIDKGDYDEVKSIADDIKENQIKISQHGKRADFIVKGMLQHSRTSTGERQLTNINILADEFLRLSYHGLRAKDKSFNAELVTNFDENLPKINIVQQDIGRVLLNLFNNAFYAVNQQQKTAGDAYKPEVSVTTSTGNGQVIIKVKDNGNGIPDAIKEKIMQPFFTTKPTGEGTGLGLSLSYDMVVKGHGGKIEVNTKDGEFTEFIITLPLKEV